MVVSATNSRMFNRKLNVFRHNLFFIAEHTLNTIYFTQIGLRKLVYFITVTI